MTPPPLDNATNAVERPSINVASHLARMAIERPNMAAVHIPVGSVRKLGTTPHRTLTFAELEADATAIAHGLADIGIHRGVRTVVMVPPGDDFFALTFAMFRVGAIPVLIDPGMGIRNLGRSLAEAEPAAFIGVAKAHLARRLFGWARRTIRTTVNVGGRRFWCTRSLDQIRQQGQGRGAYSTPEVAPSEPAAILFTSGSTGPAKGVEYTHGIFDAQIRSLRQTYGIEPGEVDLCTFPLFALFGPALGMTGVVPDMDATRPARIDPEKAIAQIRQFNVTNLFGSPAVIRRLGDFGGTPLTSVRRVISAGAPASAASIERMTKLLPTGARVFTPYGATEALPVSNIGSDEILGETRRLTEQGRGVCVGKPVAGLTVSIIAIIDEPIRTWQDARILPGGEVGEIVVRGPVVTKKYFHRDAATELAKIIDEATGEVLHRMGDVGYLDDQGRLWFCGRKAHRVVTLNGTLFTDMVEPIFNRVPGVARTALVGVTRDGVTFPVVCVESERDKKWPSVVELRKAGEEVPTMAGIRTFLFRRRFPVDVRHNSKINRESLARWADRRLSAKWRGDSTE